MSKCPLCGKEIYWVIVKGRVFAVPFSYKDTESELARFLKYNTTCGMYCPKCFGKLNINKFEELVEFLSINQYQKSLIEMKDLRCPKCGDMITEEDIIAYDGESLVTFRHCGRYWNVKIEKSKTEVIETNDIPTSQCWLTLNGPICRVTTASEDSDEAI